MFHCFMDICKQQGVHVIIYNQDYILSKQTNTWLAGLWVRDHANTIISDMFSLFYLCHSFLSVRWPWFPHHTPKTPCDYLSFFPIPYLGNWFFPPLLSCFVAIRKIWGQPASLILRVVYQLIITFPFFYLCVVFFKYLFHTWFGQFPQLQSILK